MLARVWVGDGTVLAVSSRALVDACDRLGIDTVALLAEVDLSRKTLDDPDGRIPAGKVGALWRAAHAAANDPHLALHAAEALPMGAYRAIDHLARNASTIGDAFAQVSKYFPIINSTVRLPIDEQDDHRCIGAVAAGGSAEPSLPYLEYTFAAIVLRVRVATGAAFPLVSVEFAAEAPGDTAEHERIFGCPVLFDRPRSVVRIARSVWDEPNALADAFLEEVLVAHAQSVLETAPQGSSLVGAAGQVASKGLRLRRLSQDWVAQQLGLSRRTLQRRLEEAGVAYSQIIDAERSAYARELLAKNELAITEVAYLLGFSDQSAFTRAFRRWTDRTPASYRRALHSGK